MFTDAQFSSSGVTTPPQYPVAHGQQMMQECFQQFANTNLLHLMTSVANERVSLTQFYTYRIPEVYHNNYLHLCTYIYHKKHCLDKVLRTFTTKWGTRRRRHTYHGNVSAGFICERIPAGTVNSKQCTYVSCINFIYILKKGKCTI